MCGALRISAFSAVKSYFNAEAAEPRWLDPSPIPPPRHVYFSGHVPFFSFLLSPAVVEFRAAQHEKALRILRKHARLFDRIHNHTLIGSYHDTLGKYT